MENYFISESHFNNDWLVKNVNSINVNLTNHKNSARKFNKYEAEYIAEKFGMKAVSESEIK